MEILERIFDLGEVVTVNGDGTEPEVPHLGIHRVGGHHFAGGAVDLQPVQVNHDTEIVQFVLGGEEERFPHFPLLDLAIAQESIHTHIILVQVLGGFGHACRTGDALAQAASALYSPGAVCPLESTNRSRSAHFGLAGSMRISLL